MAKTTDELKAHFQRLASTKGYICEEDCIRAFTEAASPAAIDHVSAWLVSSSFKLLKGVGQQYKQELLERVLHPNVRDVKDTKDHTHNNKDKKQESKKTVEEVAAHDASMHFNKIIEESKDKETEDEFLPPWKRDAAEIPVENFAGWQQWLIDWVDNHQRDVNDPDGWKNYVMTLQTAQELTDAWSTLMSGAHEPPPSTKPLEGAPLEPEQEFDWSDDSSPPLELASAGEDPVDKHLGMIARGEYTSTIKKKVKFDNDTVFTVDVADTPAQKAAGLEVFESLAERAGLLFPFAHPDHVTFHMGRVKFPIDILFLMHDDLGMKVAKIVHNANPGDLDLWSCPDTACVLEIPGGSCSKLGIGIASYCKISDRIEVA